MSVPRIEGHLTNFASYDLEWQRKDHHDPAAYIFCPGICSVLLLWGVCLFFLMVSCFAIFYSHYNPWKFMKDNHCILINYYKVEKLFFFKYISQRGLSFSSYSELMLVMVPLSRVHLQLPSGNLFWILCNTVLNLFEGSNAFILWECVWIGINSPKSFRTKGHEPGEWSSCITVFHPKLRWTAGERYVLGLGSFLPEGLRIEVGLKFQFSFFYFPRCMACGIISSPVLIAQSCWFFAILWTV